MKIFADNCLQEAKPEFVTAKLWHSSRQQRSPHLRQKTQLCRGQCIEYPDIKMKFANDREMVLMSPQSPFYITP